MNGLRLILLLIVAALALRFCELATSRPNDMPWAPLSLSDAIGPFTIRKLGNLRDDPRQCHQLLGNGDIAYRTVPAVNGPGVCGYRDGVNVTDEADFRIRPALVAACPIAASLSIWRYQVVEPSAYRHFKQSVVQIDTFGSYACRTIGNAEGAAMSEHANANAVDIAGFHLKDGRRITIASDWHDQGAAGAFLRDVRDGACRVFATTLSPDYNAAHHDHLHLDQALRGGWCYCG